MRTFKQTLVGKTVLAFIVLSSASFAFAQTYKVPPSSTVMGDVPVISDEAMEACVKLYNEAEWLYANIRSTRVDQYSQASVDAYNAKIARHNRMTTDFNLYCAGKQSQSAYEAAQRLNEQKARENAK